ncbi:MAG TPA: response regulator [Opitutaceae bacterium]|nr:response regulator [Opitutaceae bacterium]
MTKAPPIRLSPTDRILIIEDNPDDSYLLVRALADAGIDNPIDSCESIDLAIILLCQMAQDERLPGVIFCDLKLPGKTGFDFLEWRNAQTRLLSLPVVITSGSALSSDVQRATRLGAHAYFVKPLTTDDVKVILGDTDQENETAEVSAEQNTPRNEGVTPTIT